MKKSALILLFVFYTVCAFAQATIKVQTQNLVSLDEQFNVTFIIDGEKSVSDFQWDAGDDFQLVWGPQKGTSTSISIVNGKRSTSAQTTFTYILMPRKSGSLTIPSATASVGRQTVTSQPVQVEVVSGEGSAKDRSTEPGQREAASDGPVDVFLKLSVSKTRVVVGEPVKVSLKLYQRANIAGFEDVRFPDFNGFWSQETQAPQNIEFHRENVGDAIYNVALLRGWTLVPQQAGEIKINPAEIVCLVNVRSPRASGGSIFDSFFQDEYQTVRKRVSTSPVTMRVSPLPAPSPESFGGGVGEFKMAVKLSRDSLKAHDAASLVVTVTGNGNLSMLDAPKVKFPPDFEVYDVKESDGAGSRTFEYPFIPRSHGEFTIPAVEYSYYSIGKSSYVTLSSGPLDISVEKSGDVPEGTAVGLVQAPSGKDVKNISTDIRYIRTAVPSFRKAGRLFAGSPLFFVLAILLIVAAAIVYFVFRFLSARRSDVVGTRKRSATKMALKRLSSANSYLQAGVRAAFYEELHKALLGFVSDKMNIDSADLCRDRIESGLEKGGVPGNIVSDFLELLDACEYARYSPDSSSSEMKTQYDKAAVTISAIDSVMKRKNNSGAMPAALILLALVFGTARPAQASEVIDSLWTRGCEAYSAGAWESAASSWEKILDEGSESAELFYNIGNARYKNGEPALAIIAWKRSLRLDPSGQDARFNLEFARGRIQDRIESVPEFFLKTWTRKVCYALGSTGWAVLCLVLLAVSLGLGLAFLLGRGIGIRRAGFFGGLSAFVLCAVCLTFSLSQKSDYTDRTEAVVTAPVVSVKSSPDASSSSDLFVLHEGTEVRIIEEVGEWQGIQLSDGRKGWIKASECVVI